MATSLSTPPARYSLVYDDLRAKYDRGVQDGSIVPITSSLVAAPFVISIAFLMIPPTSIFHNILTRIGMLAILYYIGFFIFINSTAMSTAASFEIGIYVSFIMVRMTAFVLFVDGKKNFAMLASTEDKPSANGARRNGNSDAKQAKIYKFYWKHYPTSSLERLDWAFDLFADFRGIGWTWKVSGLPSYPMAVQSQLDPSAFAAGKLKDRPISRTGIVRPQYASTCVRDALWTIVNSFLIMDLAFTIMHQDPYFWGFIDAPPPSYFPSIITQSWVITRLYRVTLGLIFVLRGLLFVTAVAPIMYLGLGRTLAKVFPSVKRWLNVRLEPWMYPQDFGSFSCVFERGLAGFWGGWWHSMFKAAFMGWGNAICKLLRTDPAGAVGRTVIIFVAFGLSAIMHALGSMTMPGDSIPWSGSFLFFATQPLGLLAEDFAARVLRRTGLPQLLPGWMKKGIRFVWVYTWFFYTAPLFVNDFARGGHMLLEPGPISCALGLGPPGVRCEDLNDFSKHALIRWHSDPKGRWWLSGVAI